MMDSSPYDANVSADGRTASAAPLRREGQMEPWWESRRWRPGVFTIYGAIVVGGWLLDRFVLLPGYTP
jgi:hypothetical protein